MWLYWLYTVVLESHFVYTGLVDELRSRTSCRVRDGMSVIKNIWDVGRKIVSLADGLKRTEKLIGELAAELRDIDRRLARLEGKWEATTVFAGRGMDHAAPLILPSYRDGE